VKRYISLQIDQLVSDVAVDPVHVRELADSIMNKGQLAPAIIREETKEVIDGFHRIAAMKELGFKEVECVLTPCDDEGFWDFRIIQASLHKNVTFARAIDWIDKVFGVSPWKNRYKNAWNLFDTAAQGYGPKEAKEWVQSKAKAWGLSPVTIKNWLYTKQSLAPDILEKAKASPLEGEEVKVSHYTVIADTLPGRPELQRQVLEKVKKEQLSPSETRAVGQAVRRAEDKEEVANILRQPISRTEDQMVRDAKVEKLLSHPREVTPLEKWQEAKHEDVLYKLDLLEIINSARAMTQEKIDALTPVQKADVYKTSEEAITEIQRVMNMLTPNIQAKYRLREG
jgi:ParB-like chromosome segregation protein Spo0J